MTTIKEKNDDEKQQDKALKAGQYEHKLLVQDVKHLALTMKRFETIVKYVSIVQASLIVIVLAVIIF